VILYSAVDVKELYRLGRHYPWERPQKCLSCGGRIWGHGFVSRYFEPFAGVFWIRCYRCPDCTTVYTMRPSLYLRGFRYELCLILSCLFHRVITTRWQQNVCRQLQQAWWKNLYRAASQNRTAAMGEFRYLVRCLFVWSAYCDILLL
jgi:hypothetical protein